MAAGKKVGCGVVNDLRPAEIFERVGPRHEMAQERYFEIIVPRYHDEHVDFKPGEMEKLFKELNFQPGSPVKFNSISVRY